MRGTVAKLPLAASVVAALALSGTAAHARNGTLRDAGDVLQYALPLSALGSSWLVGDPEGRAMFAKSFAGSWTTVQVLKNTVRKLRPSRASRTSWPSGHTQAAFSGAAYLGTRYGPWIGIPAYAAAGVTGWSRQWADAHFIDDVVAGASITMLYNFAFVNPYSESTIITPTRIGDGYGVRLRVTDLAGEDKKSGPDVINEFISDFKFDFSSGAAWMVNNTFKVPSSGTRVDLRHLDQRGDPTQTSVVTLEYFIDDRQSIRGFFAPFEARDEGSFDFDVSFAGAFFPANTPIFSEWRNDDYRLLYNYKLVDNGTWDATLGGGAALLYTFIKLQDQADTIDRSQSDMAFLPVIRGEFGYGLTDEFRLFGQAYGGATTNDTMFDLAAGLEWHWNERWNAAAGYAYFDRDVEYGDFDNKWEYQALFVNFGYKF